MKTLAYVLTVIAIAVLSSCGTPRYAYSPVAHNVPVITQKGDGKVGISYSTNPSGREVDDDDVKREDRSKGFDLQGAYAISDNWAIQIAHARRWEKTTGGSDSSTVKYDRNLTELGVGYYFPLTSKKKAFFQLFGGGGWGKFSFTDASKYGYFYHEANVVKIYIQPAMLFRSKGSFSTSIAIRGSIMSFNAIRTNYNSSQLEDFSLDSLGSGSRFFIEPGFVSSFGFKNVPGLRIEFQGGLSALIARRELDFRPVNLSIGTYIDFGSLMKRSGK